MAKRKVKTKAVTKKKTSKKVAKKVSKKTAKKKTARKKTSKKKTNKKKAGAKSNQMKSLIGVDPLAWLDAENSEEEVLVDEEQEAADIKIRDEEVSMHILKNRFALEVSKTEGVEELVTKTNDSEMTVQGQEEISGSGEFYIDIDLGTSLTIRDISMLMEELNQIDDAKQNLIFETENLEKVDTAALQLLSGYYLFATGAGKTVTWHNPSDALCHASELLGLKDILNLTSIHN